MGTISNARKRARKMKLYHEQNGKCYYCGKKMGLPELEKHRKPGTQSPMEVTLEHLDDKYSEYRGKFKGMERTVAACWGCNNGRNHERMKQQPREMMHVLASGVRTSELFGRQPRKRVSEEARG